MKTSTERVREMRQRRQAQGLVRVDVFIRPSEREALQKFMATLEAKRKRANHP